MTRSMNPATLENSIILVPVYKYLERETDIALRELEELGWTVRREYGCSAIDQARATLASQSYFRGIEWLFWIDADQDFTLQNFLRLAKLEELFCCAPYSHKMGGGYICVNHESVNAQTRGLVEVQAAGFGFMKTHRRIYDMMREDGLPVCYQVADRRDNPLVPFFQPRVWVRDGRNVYYGEDYSFCMHARKLGFKLIADFDNQIGHIGRWSFRIREPL